MIAMSIRKNTRPPTFFRGTQQVISFVAVGYRILQIAFHNGGGFSVPGALAFTAVPCFQHRPKNFNRRHLTSSLAMGISPATSRVSISVPSQAKCEELGVREWPQQSKKGTWNEEVSPENSLTRYVLEGKGSLEIVQGSDETTKLSVTPGTLVEIGAGTPDLQLEWKSETADMILLTPGFEEGGVFLGAIAGILVLFGILLSGALG